MGAITVVETYRPSTIGRVLSVPQFSDLALNAASIYPGELVKVVSTGKIYLCSNTAEFTEIGAQAAGDGSAPKAFRGVDTSFADLVGKAVANTDTSAQIASGVTIHGQGVAETDSGVTVALGYQGPVASVIATDEAEHTCCLSVGGATELWKPGTDGPLHVYAEVAMSSALTTRAFFLGFHGAYADAQDPICTGSTTTITLVEDNLQGLYFDTGLTDADRLFAPYNNADGAATIATTATGVDTSTDFPAAGTYIKLEVVILANGTMVCYANGSEITRIASAASTTVALNPILYVESQTTATSTMLVKRFAAWAEQ